MQVRIATMFFAIVLTFAAAIAPPRSLAGEPNQVVATAATPENWSAWRGPTGTGVTAQRNLPLKWSDKENVRWRVDLPEAGNSTPVIWGDRIFVSQPLAKEKRRTLMCFDKANGKLLWQQGVEYAEKEPTHATNPYCSPSPVTDGKSVIVWYGSAGLVSYDLNGKQQWRRDLGSVNHGWGSGSSPVLHGDLCIINYGPGDPSFVIAVNKNTGETVWKMPAPHERSQTDATGPTNLGEKGDANDKFLFGSWATPLVITHEGREELILTLPQRVVALNPATGAELWSCEGLADLVYTSPMWGDGVIVSMGGYFGPSLAVKPGGSGDVTATHRLWHTPRSKLRMPTGVIHEGRIYSTDTNGIADCLDLKTGKAIWTKRLSSASGKSEIWSSALLSGDTIYWPNQGGDTFVYKASPTFELLSTNSVGERSNSSLAPVDGDLIFRTHRGLWRLGGEAK